MYYLCSMYTWVSLSGRGVGATTSTSLIIGPYVLVIGQIAGLVRPENET